jgi:hypothetical protein
MYQMPASQTWTSNTSQHSPVEHPFAGSSPISDEKYGLGAPPCTVEAPRMLERFPTNPVCDLSDEVETTEQFSVAHGGFADIYKGIWARSFCGEKGKTVVCLYVISTT